MRAKRGRRSDASAPRAPAPKSLLPHVQHVYGENPYTVYDASSSSLLFGSWYSVRGPHVSTPIPSACCDSSAAPWA